MPKRGPGETCGDAVCCSPHYAAVIDGATPKRDLLWDGRPSDAFIAEVLSEAVSTLPPAVTAHEAFRQLSAWLIIRCKEEGCDLRGMPPNERPQASVILFSVARKELWSLGDCCFLMKGKEHRNSKEIDKLLSKLRVFAHEVNRASIEAGANAPWGDDARLAIQPLLEQQAWLANKDSRFGYGVLDGSHEALDFVQVIPVGDEEKVVIATDGYPRLFDTLEQSEAYLSKCLAADPDCLRELCGTKGVAAGNVSYDDRAYLSLIA